MTGELFAPLSLRSGQVLKNRIAKAAMEENMAGPGSSPTSGCSRSTGAGRPAVRGC